MNAFRLASQADADLDEIADFIADRSPSSALRVIDRLYETFAILATQPLLGQSCDDPGGNLRVFSAGIYAIFYVPLTDGIEVQRVIHGARDIDSFF